MLVDDSYCCDDNNTGTCTEENKQTWYKDGDGDGYGIDSDTKRECTKPSGYADKAGDCDDSPSGGNVHSLNSCGKCASEPTNGICCEEAQRCIDEIDQSISAAKQSLLILALREGVRKCGKFKEKRLVAACAVVAGGVYLVSAYLELRDLENEKDECAKKCNK